jgi:polyphosphate glucokinase
MQILGIDIGGSGIKAAPVNTDTGEMIDERYRLPTPEGAKPGDVAEVIAGMVDHFKWKGPIGAGFPAAIRNGITLTAANVDSSWIGTDAASLFKKRTGCPFYIANDADVAGLAEITFGAGRGENGVILVITLGTGVGTGLFVDGILVPNTELGHIEIRGKDAEQRVSDAARQRKDWSFKEWAVRVNEYLERMENLFWPDLIIIGGGVSKSAEKFFPYLHTRARLVQAKLLNQAGIVGAALFALRKIEASGQKQV